MLFTYSTKKPVVLSDSLNVPKYNLRFEIDALSEIILHIHVFVKYVKM